MRAEGGKSGPLWWSVSGVFVVAMAELCEYSSMDVGIVLWLFVVWCVCLVLSNTRSRNRLTSLEKKGIDRERERERERVLALPTREGEAQDSLRSGEGDAKIQAVSREITRRKLYAEKRVLS